MTTGADIVDCARSFCDDEVTGRRAVRWRHQGTTRRGCDCIGLIGAVAAELGITDVWAANGPAAQRFKGYGRLPQMHLIYQACAEFLVPVFPKESARPGDVMLLTFETDPQHFAFYCERDVDGIATPYMIHAYAQARRVTENRIDDLWRSRWVCAYRFPGVTS